MQIFAFLVDIDANWQTIIAMDKIINVQYCYKIIFIVEYLQVIAISDVILLFMQFITSKPAFNIVSFRRFIDRIHT